MEALILALSPFLVQILTSITKRLPAIGDSYGAARIWGVRLLAAVFAIVLAWLGGEAIDATLIETLALALLNFLGATGSHFILAGKK